MDYIFTLISYINERLFPFTWGILWFFIGWIFCWLLNPWELKK